MTPQDKEKIISAIITNAGFASAITDEKQALSSPYENNAADLITAAPQAAQEALNRLNKEKNDNADIKNIVNTDATKAIVLIEKHLKRVQSMQDTAIDPQRPSNESFTTGDIIRHATAAANPTELNATQEKTLAELLTAANPNAAKTAITMMEKSHSNDEALKIIRNKLETAGVNKPQAVPSDRGGVVPTPAPSEPEKKAQRL